MIERENTPMTTSSDVIAGLELAQGKVERHVPIHERIIMDECRAAKTPLIELLRSVPKHAVEMYEHNPTHHQNIPYGRLCHEAADALEIAKRDERIAELEADQDKANAAVAIGNYLGKTYNYAWCNTSLASQTIDLLKEQAARIKELEERRCEICGYAEHHREHTGCLRVFVDEQAAEISRLRKVLAKCRDGIEGSLSDCLPYINKCKEALAAIKEEGL